jgi:hypothetical protein
MAVTRRPRPDLVKFKRSTYANVNYRLWQFKGCQTRCGYTIEIVANWHPQGQSGRPIELHSANSRRPLGVVSAWIGVR